MTNPTKVPTHVHIWREIRVGCEDCGDHPALICDGEGECPEMEGISVPYLDLITYEDPWLTTTSPLRKRGTTPTTSRQDTSLDVAAGAAPRTCGTT